MTPLARLQAAIRKLEQLNTEGHPGPWWHDVVFGGVWSGTGLASDVEVTHDATEEDADLIVTLHRTITAQLGFLRDQVRRLEVEQDRALESIALHYRHALALADAILGGES